MNSNDTRGPRHGRGGRRPSNRNPRRDNDDRRNSRNARGDGDRKQQQRNEPPKKLSFWGKILAFFTGGAKKQTSPARPAKPDTRTAESRGTEPRPSEPRNNTTRRAAPPERVEVSSPKLYVGNLSYEATENDLSELFNGVGKVQNAEIVTHKGTYRSKGFGFVTMLTLDEALRAVQELHDKPFMGRNLVVSGSKSDGPRDA